MLPTGAFKQGTLPLFAATVRFARAYASAFLLHLRSSAVTYLPVLQPARPPVPASRHHVMVSCDVTYYVLPLYERTSMLLTAVGGSECQDVGLNTQQTLKYLPRHTMDKQLTTSMLRPSRESRA